MSKNNELKQNNETKSVKSETVGERINTDTAKEAIINMILVRQYGIKH